MFGLINTALLKALDLILTNVIYLFQNLSRLHLVISDFIRPRYKITVGSKNYNPEEGVIVLSVYYPGLLPPDTKWLIEFYSRFYTVIVVSADDLRQPDLEFIDSLNCVAIERHNVGRDFGSYKAAIHWLESQKHNSTLVLANDSIFINKQLMSRFFHEAENHNSVFAISKVYERHTHLGAFCLFIPKKIFLNYEFRRFWKRYIPINSKRWCVFHGEVKLSNVLFGISDETIFPGEYYSTISVKDFEDSLNSGLMATFHSDILSEFNRHELSNFKNNALNPNSNANLTCMTGVVEALANINTIALSNNPGHFTGLYKFITGQSVYLKKDVFYRGAFNVWQLDFMDEIGFCSQDEALYMKRKILSKDFGPEYVGIKKYMFNRGLI